MLLFGFLFVLGCVVSLAAGRAIGRWACARLGDATPRWLPGIALVPALLPLAWHYQSALALARADLSASNGDLEGLSLLVPFAVVVLWLVGTLAVRRLPLLAVAFPILAVFLYVRFVLARLLGPPRDLPVDREAFVILLGSEALATCAAFGFVWGVIGLLGMLRSWPRAER
ncbi:hypothetical protein B2G71_05275 [Novosphingobium sp. PC22D]|uniref:hypothetical protein n=1 Tax=Novosphingobium sp. PC22D TaxID=1962403 RepID=UPI000BF17452|nr:hypothetical protein [Novosphingobium sp. PC22D]PEQ13731.1 hypothetical protein B2G71_05275 [Novosphingobium sp. PC22D]